MALRRAGRSAPREVDDAAARLVARARVVVITLAVLAAGLAYGEAGKALLQYTLAFAALPLAVALALAADKLPSTTSAGIGAGIDALVFAVAVASFPDAVGSLSAAYLVAVLLASYTGGRILGTATGSTGIAVVAVADALDRVPASRELVLLLAIAVAVSLAIVGRTDARLLRSAGRARYHEQRASLLLEHLAEPVVVTGEAGQLVLFNDAAHALLQIPGGGVDCTTALGLRVDGRPLDCSGGCGLLGLEGSQDSGGIEASACPAGREPIPVLVSVSEVPGRDGQSIEHLHTVRDITKLKLADEAKTLFLATTTHELKTPLTVIRGFLDTIDQPSVDDALRATAMAVMRRRADELSGIVDRVLLASRIESGRIQLELEDLEVDVIARDRVSAIAAATGRTIALRSHDGLPPARVDRAGLATVLDHLLDNACKYSPAATPIEVAVEAGPADVEIAVRDEGNGMTEDQLRHCFDRFWQADASARRHVGGTGIGLFLVRSLVESMGATISVQSRIGDGSTFTMRFRRSDLPDGRPGEVERRAPEPSIVREFMRQIGVDTREVTP